MSAAVLPAPSATPAADPAPEMRYRYESPKAAIYIGTNYLTRDKGGLTDSAVMRRVDVIGLDSDTPAKASRAFVASREGREVRKYWVFVSTLASTPAAAADKLRVHISALLSLSRPASNPLPGMTESDCRAVYGGGL